MNSQEGRTLYIYILGGRHRTQLTQQEACGALLPPSAPPYTHVTTTTTYAFRLNLRDFFCHPARSRQSSCQHQQYVCAQWCHSVLVLFLPASRGFIVFLLMFSLRR